MSKKLKEEPLEGGRSSQGLVRIGNTVRRPLSPNSKFVHQVLRQLERTGFGAAPRYIGIDNQGRGVLTFFEGAVPHNVKKVKWTDAQLKAL